MTKVDCIKWFNNVRKIAILIAFTCICQPMLQATQIVKIKNQKDFDEIQEIILASIKRGEEGITISLSPGSYYFKDHHIALNNIIASDFSLHIYGNNATILPQGKDYQDGDTYEGRFSVNNSWMSFSEDINIWSKARYAQELIEVIDSTTKECRLKSGISFPTALDCSNAYILITQWFRSYVYKITKIDNPYIYFTAESLAPGYKNNGYNINNDYYYGGQYPRYKLCNIETEDNNFRIIDGTIRLPKGITSIREGKTNTIIDIVNCNFRKIEVKNLRFFGNSNISKSAAININNTACDNFSIHDCEFRGFRSSIISAISSHNILVEHNIFKDCYTWGIRFENGCKNTTVRLNSFTSMGKGMDNVFCVVCRGEDFNISNNEFSNYGYGGIGAGVHFKSEMRYKCTGRIEGNVLSYTSEYLSDKENYTTMDSGAIYLWTKNNGILVRNNFVHDISGMRTNQGIYCDDGASGVQVIGNIVIGIDNSYCIGSRRDDRAEEHNYPGSGIESSNLNNIIQDNIIDGPILFGGNEKHENGCILGNNYVLISEESIPPAHNIKNVTEEGSIVALELIKRNGYLIVLNRQSYRFLRKSPEWKAFKKHVKRN